MIVKARFKGKSGRFESNHEYFLEITLLGWGGMIVSEHRIGSIQYSSVFDFFRNWTDIKTP